MNYDHCANRIWDVWGSMDNYLYERLIKWCLRRHGNKTNKWVFEKYWKHIDGRWTFTVTTKQGETYKLNHYDLGQKRTGSRISSNTNVFDLRNRKKIRQVQIAKGNNLTHQKGTLWKKQRGTCPVCKQLMDPTQHSRHASYYTKERWWVGQIVKFTINARTLPLRKSLK